MAKRRLFLSFVLIATVAICSLSVWLFVIRPLRAQNEPLRQLSAVVERYDTKLETGNSQAFADRMAALKQAISHVKRAGQGESAAHKLIGLLKSENAAIRWNAGYALAALGPDAKVATADLIEALKDSDRSVSAIATRALSRIDPAMWGQPGVSEDAWPK